MAANLKLKGCVTDGSSLDMSKTGILVSHAVYYTTIEADDDNLPDGIYHLQMWNDMDLLASTDQVMFDDVNPFHSLEASPSPSPSPAPSEQDEWGIVLEAGIGYGILDLRTQPIEDLVQEREKTEIVLTLYESSNFYLPARITAQLTRNEAGFCIQDYELINPENSIIFGPRTFAEFPKTPADDPVEDTEAANKQFVDKKLNLDNLEEQDKDPLKIFANLNPSLDKAGDISASESEGKRFLNVTDTSEPRTVTISQSSLISGVILYVKDKSGNAGVNPITIQVEMNDDDTRPTIDGQTQIQLWNNRDCLMVYSDGENLFNLNSSVVIR